MDNQLSIELVVSYSNKILKDILTLEQQCFPLEWQYEDAEFYFCDNLKNKDNINVLLKCGNKIVGYLLATPHNDAFEEIVKFDPAFRKQFNVYYIETIEILPSFRGRGGLRKLIGAACDDGKKRGINHFSIHARTSNGLSAAIEKYFKGSIDIERDIQEWKFGGNEPYKYIEWHY